MILAFKFSLKPSKEKNMSNKKFVVFLSLLAILIMLLSACQPAATEKAPVASPAASGGGLICVIVPGVENPFFGSEQEIAAAKAEELGYETLKLVHDDDANKEMEL
ncbi:MAG: hypothetical protein AB1894_08245, partial [Chloroflexota bacterium]